MEDPSLTFQRTILSTLPLDDSQSQSERNSRGLLSQSDNSTSFEITESKFSATFGGGTVFFTEYPSIESINHLRKMMDILTDALIEEKL